MKKSIYILQISIAVILLIHAIPGMFDGGVNAFGEFFLNAIGFAPFGVTIAWAVKLSHVVCAIALVANRFVKLASIITIFVLIMGIVLVHFKEGWFVVGGGRNGVEYNVLMIMVLIAIMVEAKQKVFSSRKES
jgi:putative oxidoreductase